MALLLGTESDGASETTAEMFDKNIKTMLQTMRRKEQIIRSDNSVDLLCTGSFQQREVTD